MAADGDISLKNDPIWADVTPIPQDDGNVNVVRISYSEQFAEVHDYLRAVMRKDERSERCFNLVTRAIELNPANYTAWHFRRVLLQHLKKDLHEELKYITEIINDKTKNYQVWHHRRCVVQWLNDPSQELEFTDDILSEDAKNYHAWEHRQWCIREYSLWQDELDYTDRLIVDDIRNNSAWNQRYFVIINTTKFTDQVVNAEFEYTKEKIGKAYNNESAWNYLRGIFIGRRMSEYAPLETYLDEVMSKNIKSPYLYAMMVDLYEDRMENKQVQENRENLTKAVSLLKCLADDMDSIRREYWNYLSKSLSLRFGEYVIEGHAP